MQQTPETSQTLRVTNNNATIYRDNVPNNKLSAPPQKTVFWMNHQKVEAAEEVR